MAKPKKPVPLLAAARKRLDRQERLRKRAAETAEQRSIRMARAYAIRSRRLASALKKQQKAAAAEAIALQGRPRPIHEVRRTLTLLYRHYINGIVYGPGQVTGPVALMEQLAENDGRAREEEDNCNDRNGRAYVIGFTGRGSHFKRPVSYDGFEATMRDVDPGMRVSGRGQG